MWFLNYKKVGRNNKDVLRDKYQESEVIKVKHISIKVDIQKPNKSYAILLAFNLNGTNSEKKFESLNENIFQTLCFKGNGGFSV